MATSNNSLLEYLKSQGYEKQEKKETLREYPEPTIEFYASGQARLRGMKNETLAFLVWHITADGVEIFKCESETEMLETAKALNWHRTATKEGKAPNMRMSEAKQFYEIVKERKPEQHAETLAGKVAWESVSVDGKRITWEK